MLAGHQAKRRADEIAGETLREADCPVATHADDNGAPASASVSHRLLFSVDARVASSAPFSKEAEGAKGSEAERDDGNSVSFGDEDDEEEEEADSNASRGRSDDEENAGETLIEAKCPVATHVEENGAAMAV